MFSRASAPSLPCLSCPSHPRSRASAVHGSRAVWMPPLGWHGHACPAWDRLFLGPLWGWQLHRAVLDPSQRPVEHSSRAVLLLGPAWKSWWVGNHTEVPSGISMYALTACVLVMLPTPHPADPSEVLKHLKSIPSTGDMKKSILYNYCGILITQRRERLFRTLSF